jgi:hypothetical protein
MNGGGPATQNGKAVVRWNATRHGISSPAPVVPGLERTEDWQAHSDGVLESLQPEGHLETVLAQRVALVSWRLHRVTRYETGAITTAQERIEEDFHDKRRFIAAMMGERFAETHPTDIRWLARYRKQAHSALKRFSSQEPDKVLKGEDASSVVCEALSAAIKRSGQEKEDENLDLPGGLQEQYELTELPAMKAAVVRECVEAIAAYASLDADELLEAATEEARFQAAIAAHKKEDMEQELSRDVAERILPDDETLQKIARYEAHLSRKLYHALHELENLQKYRTTGEGTPLARVDVQGLPGS